MAKKLSPAFTARYVLSCTVSAVQAECRTANITSQTIYGGDLYTFTGKEKAIELMQYVDKINLEMGGQDAKLYSTTSSDIKAMALKYDLHLLDAQVRHLGTDRNMQILQNIYDFVKDKIEHKILLESSSG